jgi:hypothetical protein
MRVNICLSINSICAPFPYCVSSIRRMPPWRECGDGNRLPTQGPIITSASDTEAPRRNACIAVSRDWRMKSMYVMRSHACYCMKLWHLPSSGIMLHNVCASIRAYATVSRRMAPRDEINGALREVGPGESRAKIIAI